MAFDKSVSLIYLKLYERYGGERSAARSLVKVFVLLSILLIMAIGRPGVADYGCLIGDEV